MGFLKKIFGSSRDELWSQLARETGGKFRKGSWSSNDSVRCSHGEWEIILDSYYVSYGNGGGTTYTRIRAPFVNKDGIQFRIGIEGFFARLGIMLGMQDIKIGDQNFDNAFRISGNDEHKIQQLFSHPEYRKMILDQPWFGLEINKNDGIFRYNHPEDISILQFTYGNHIRNLDQMKGLFDIFATTLERLVAIDSAYETDPKIIL